MAPDPEFPPSSAHPAPRASVRAWIARLILAFAAPLLTLLLLEAVLRSVGFGHSPDFFIPDEQPGLLRTNPHYTESFFPASFGQKPQNFRLPRHKPKDSVRIFVAGESAALGVPEPGFGMGPHLRAQLRSAYPSKGIEVYDLGITAINSHVVRDIVRQALRLEPDLVVVYMGNNEVVGPYGPSSAVNRSMPPLWVIRTSIWLRGTRTGQLMRWLLGKISRRPVDFVEWRGMETFSGKAVAADDPRLQEVYANFSANLADIVDCARRSGVRVVLSTVAVNVRDCSPFGSRHRPGLSDADLGAWKREFEAAETSLDLGATDRAEAAAAGALAIDPEQADTQFLMARILDARGDVAGARPYYIEALRQDTLRFRADPRINQIIRDEAGKAGVTLVDAAAELGSDGESKADPAGAGLFLEHVHFTWEGNYAVSRLLAAGAARSLFGDGTPGSWLDSAECAQALGFTHFGRATILLRMLEPDGRPPFTAQRTFAADRTRLNQAIVAENSALGAPGAMAEAVASIHRARERDPRPFLFSHEAAADIRLGNLAAALELNKRLGDLQPPSAEDAVQRAYILQQLGRMAEAESLLLQTARSDPYYFQTYGLLAAGWEKSQAVAEAKAYFEALARRMPGRNAQIPYAQLLAATGNGQGAETVWREVLRSVPDEEGALAPLTDRLLGRHDSDQALDLMLRAYAYNPRSFSNNLRLVQIYEARRDLPNVTKYMEALAESGPVRPNLYADLASALFVLGRRNDATVALARAKRGAEAAGDAELLKAVDDLAQKNGIR